MSGPRPGPRRISCRYSYGCTAEGNGSSGNYALFDIVKACRWVKNNIAAFGGDPDNISTQT
ncbi:carboxylesterase family protein [Lachnoclostridium sp. Marseille-P6806]|uniref:carboxylesterase family protein n=1 Tax=Lachnoclostridium sp. Marseille-P6806 TaxID=2364793 RepID=UPI0010323E8A